MIPPRGAQPHERALDALAKRRRRDGALAFAEERGAQGVAIGGRERAEHRQRHRFELAGQRLLLGVARAVDDRGDGAVAAVLAAPRALFAASDIRS